MARLTLLVILLLSCRIALAADPVKVAYPNGKFEHSFTIEDAGDKFSDWHGSRVRMKGVADSLDVAALSKVDNETGLPYDAVTITFHNDGDQKWFKDLKTVVFLADGKRIAIGNTVFVNGGMLGAVVNHEDLSKLLAAKAVEGKVGMLEFKLTDEHLNCLRDFASKIPAGKTKSGKIEIAH